MTGGARTADRYDELHMNAVVNWTKSTKSDGTPLPGIPALMGTSLQVRRAQLQRLRDLPSPPTHDRTCQALRDTLVTLCPCVPWTVRARR